MIADVQNSAHARYLRVRFNGTDISKQCFYADSMAGTAKIYLYNEGGKKYLWSENVLPATAEICGHVEIFLADGAPEKIKRWFMENA